MKSMIARRLLVLPVTLFVLSLLVFFGGQVLPGNVGRSILGPFASETAVQVLNAKLGTDRPIAVQYVDWVSKFATGDMGQSYLYRTPVAPVVATAITNSAKLTFVAFCMVVPLGIAAGVLAALHVGRPLDRLISNLGLAAAILPEFVTGILLILILGIWLGWLPISATWPAGSGLWVQLHHLILPALPLVLVLFGYIARMTRAGMIEALDADYTRTAILKGLPRVTVLRRHVLRNAVLPTVAVLGTQAGQLMGGLVVTETLFRYQGIGSLIFNAARNKDFPLMQAGVLTVGLTFCVITLATDLLLFALNPRLRSKASS